MTRVLRLQTIVGGVNVLKVALTYDHESGGVASDDHKAVGHGHR